MREFSSLRENARRLASLSLTGLFWITILSCSLTSASGASLPGDSIHPVDSDGGSGPVINAPGEYRFTDRCVPVIDVSVDMVEIPGAPGVPPNFVPDVRMSTMDLCVTGVAVRADRQMQFNVSYTLAPMEDEENEVIKGSDAGNRKIYLLDDRGRRYEYLDLGGCAAEEMRTAKVELKCEAWFLFPPAQDGARSFDFYYSMADSTEDSTPSVIGDIILSDPE